MKIIFAISLLVILLGCASKSKLHPHQEDIQKKSLTFVQDSVQSPSPINYLVFVDSVARSKEVKILQDAGVPCRVEFEVFVDENGKYLEHKWIGDTCHPLAEEAIEKYISVLKFKPGRINGKNKKMWVKMNLKWTTW